MAIKVVKKKTLSLNFELLLSHVFDLSRLRVFMGVVSEPGWDCLGMMLYENWQLAGDHVARCQLKTKIHFSSY